MLVHDVSFLTPEDFHNNNINPFEFMPIPQFDDSPPTGIIEDKTQFVKYRNISLRDYLLNMPYNEKVYLEIKQHGVDVTESELMCTLLVYECNHTPILDYLIFEKRIFRKTIKNRIKITKHVHTLLRASHTLPDGTKITPTEAVKSQYINLLPSRRSYMSEDDWKEDVAERLRPPPDQAWITIQNGRIHRDSKRFANEVYITLKQMFEEMITQHINDALTFEEVLIRIHTWLASGSSGLKYNGVPVDKRSAFELGLITIKDILEATPRVLISGSTKYENGKDRALYSTDFISYCYQSYILMLIEPYINRLPESGLSLTQSQSLAMETEISNYAKRRDIFGWAFDFANFNANHSIPTMQSFWRASGEVLNDKVDDKIKPDVSRVIQWLIESEDNMILRSGDNKIIGYRKTTLTSGERATATKNILLNIAYKRVMIKNVQQLTDYNPLVMSKHAGDDVIGFVNNRASGFILTLWYKVLGFPSQGTKVAMQTEFLRYYYGTDGSINGYPNRSLVNLITRDQNRGSEKHPLTFGASFYTQIKKCVARGADPTVLNALYDIMLKLHSEFHDNKGSVYITKPMIHSRVENGGTGMIDNNHIYDNCVINNLPKETANTFLEKRLTNIKPYMSKIFLDEIEHLFADTIKFDHSFRELKKVKNLVGLEDQKDKYMQRDKLAQIMRQVTVNCTEYQPEPLHYTIQTALTDIKNILNQIQSGKYPAIPDYLIKFNSIRKMIASTPIKQTDVFQYVVRYLRNKKGLNTSLAIREIFEKLDIRDAIVVQFNNTIAHLGLTATMMLINNELSLNVITDGAFRSTLCSYIRDFGLAYLMHSEYINTRFEDIDTTNTKITKWIYQFENEVNKFILNDKYLYRWSTP